MADRALVHKMPLYEQLAAAIARQIERGAFRPGERIPSVRETSRQRGLSVTTVLQAYQMLEDRRLIEARPQSGYFVLPRTVAVMREPEAPAPACDPTTVDIDDLATMVLWDTTNPGLVQFGCAMPDPNLLPTEKLNRLLGGIARTESARQNPCAIPAQRASPWRPAAPRTFMSECSRCALPGGCEELRGQVARRAFGSGCSLSPDDIVITSGCTEALHLALRAVSKPGDLVAIESPTYFGILQILQSLGLQALEIPTHHQTGISLDALRFALDHHTVSACLVTPNFQNPLGSAMPDEHKRALVALLAEREIPLIEDDLFGELYFSGQRPRTAKAYDCAGSVILCSSFSKDLSPGYRVGWAAPGRFKTRFERLKIATNLGTAVLPQLAIARFIANGGYDHHLRRIRRAYAEKVAAMSQAVSRFFPAGTQISAPGGGFVLWVQMPESVDSLDLYRQALKVGITIAPGYIFSTTPRYRNFIRLNAAYMSDETAVGLRRLAELVERAAVGEPLAAARGR